MQSSSDCYRFHVFVKMKPFNLVYISFLTCPCLYHQLSLRSCIAKSQTDPILCSIQTLEIVDQQLFGHFQSWIINVCMSVCPPTCPWSKFSSLVIRESQKGTKLCYMVHEWSLWLHSPSSFSYSFAEDQHCSLQLNNQDPLGVVLREWGYPSTNFFTYFQCPLHALLQCWLLYGFHYRTTE